MQPDTHLDADEQRKLRHAEWKRAWRKANPEKAREIATRARKRALDKDPDYFAKRVAKWRAANPQQHRDQCKKWAYDNKEKRMYNSARWRARRKNVPFTIQLSDIQIPTHCPVLGIELTKGSKNRDTRPSLDRIEPSLGYVPGNVVVISLRANRIKNDATAHELFLVHQWLSSHHSKSGIH